MNHPHRAARDLPGGPVLAVAAVVLALALGGDTPRWAAWFGIYDRTEERVVLGCPVRAGDLVELTHTHSVHRRPVAEVFSVTAADGLAMEEMRFDAHGANLPSGPETIGGVTTAFVREASGYRVLHHGRPLGTVRMLVGAPDVDHTVTVGDTRVRLLDLAHQGGHVELYVHGGLGEPTGN